MSISGSATTSVALEEVELVGRYFAGYSCTVTINDYYTTSWDLCSASFAYFTGNIGYRSYTEGFSTSDIASATTLTYSVSCEYESATPTFSDCSTYATNDDYDFNSFWSLYEEDDSEITTEEIIMLSVSSAS